MMTGSPRSTGGAPRCNRRDRQFAEVRSDVADLRHTLTQYHASVLGHGILISDLERRVLRIEEHLHLPPVADI